MLRISINKFKADLLLVYLEYQQKRKLLLNSKCRKMKKLFMLSLFCCCFSLFGFSQMDTKYLSEGIWTEKENGISELKWTFHSSGTFNQIAFWNNSSQVGGTFSNGKFNYDKNSNIIKLNYEKYSLITNDSIEVDKFEKNIEWKIKSISENEMVINRPINKELEKQLKSYDGKNVDIVLRRAVKLPYKID
jgi:hypothetical protein